MLNATGLSGPATRLTIKGGAIQFTANGVAHNVVVPDAVITYTNTVAIASTSFDAAKNQWNTTAPLSPSHRVFMAGVAYPVTVTLPGDITPVSWTATFYSDTPGVSVTWQWAAAVYTSFSPDLNALGVKAVDGNAANQYPNSDRAGTPENFKPFVVGGVRGGGGSNWTGSYSGAARVVPAVINNNRPPVANAGPDQTVFVGTTVRMDGTSSSDPDGNSLTYQWTMVTRPAGSTATLSSTTSPIPTFLADKPGSYTLELVVNDGQVNSAPDQVVVSTQNSAPVANAGPDQTVTTQSTAQLDGRGSSDVDGDPLTYQWTIVSKPQNSNAILSEPTVVSPTFVADAPGSYTVQLVVNDGHVDSPPDQVVVSTVNSAPVANAGPNQSLVAGTTVQLNGSGSTDVDGDALNYSWSILSKPQGSTATLSNPLAVNPTFLADMVGTYVVQLIVNDGTVDGQASTVTITSENTPPVANAGPDQTVPLGSQVTLNGIDSSDVDGQTLTYQWSILSKPSGSIASLSSNTAVNPVFTADRAGSYVIQLIVNDGFTDSAPDSVIISTINSRPVADAGPDQTVIEGNTVTLNGSASTDADGDPLTYTWAILSQPADNTANLSDPHAVKPTFVANVPGVYVAQLIVSDGKVDSAPDTVMITAEAANQPPIVSAGPDQTISLPADTVLLNGSAADDGKPFGSTLTVVWSKVSGPGTATFTNPAQAVTQVTLDTVGTYVLRLTATDSQLSSSADVTVILTPANQPPMVTVGPDQTITFPNNTASLTGTVTDDGLPPASSLIISWSKLAGAGNVTFANPAQPNTQAAFSQPGVYVLQLSASDGQYMASGAMRITFSAPQAGGISVNAGPNQVVAFANPAALAGSASDSNPPSGSTLATAWSKVSGPGTVSFSDPNSPATSATVSAPGVYVLRLTATNGSFMASSDTTVYSGNLQCTQSNKGTDFWLMFLSQIKTGNTLPPETDLLISGDKATNGTVSVPGIGFTATFSVTPGQVTKIVLPQTVEVDTSDTVENKGIHITAQDPVGVYGLNFLQFATDGFLGLPTPALGTEYIIASYKNNSSTGAQGALGTEFGITATQNNTTVTIIPKSKSEPLSSGSFRSAGVPYTVQLNQGQTYQLRNKKDLNFDIFNRTNLPADMTGSIIVSDKPIAVFGGHFCTYIPGGFQACNSLIEQLPPTNLWGSNFLTMPLSGEHAGDYFRFIASVDGTHVQVNGFLAAVLNRGDFGEQLITKPSVISSDHPILIAQYAQSQQSPGVNNVNVDPTMIVVPPFEQYGGTTTFSTPTVGFPTNLVNVIAATATAQAGAIKLDGTPIPSTAFSPIDATGFSGAQVSVSIGTHTVSSPLPFGATIYGFALTDAYGYPGSVCLAKGVSGSTLTASPHASTNPITSQVCVQATVRDAAESPIGGIGVTFKVAGVNSQTTTISTDSTGVATFCYTSLQTGSDLITITADAASDTSSVTWVSNGPNQPPLVSAGANQTISLPVNSIQLVGSVVDDGLPIGGTLTSAWSQVSGPAAVAFSTPNQPTTSATFPQAGTYVLQLTANDSQLSASATITLIVLPPNQPPTVSAGTDKTFLWVPNTGTTIAITGTASDDGLPQGSSLALSWSQFAGPDLAVILSPTSATTSVRFPVPGTYVLILSASDGQFTSTSTVTINALGPTLVSAGPSLTALTGTAITLNGSITIGGQPAGNEFPIQWFKQFGPTGGNVTFSSPNSPVTTATFSAAGTYTLSLQITTAINSSAGFGASTTVIVSPPGTLPPTVSIAAPLDDAAPTSPTPVVGSVSAGNWTLEYALQDDINPPSFVILATGVGPVTNATLGTIDPTLLLNGTYVLRLRTIASSGLSAAAQVNVTVSRNMKVGVFTLSFNDLTIPVTGLPIQIIRTYDSRDKGVGDFGTGWRLSIANVRLQKNHNLGLAWQESLTFTGFTPQYCLSPTQNLLVTITFPDGKVYKFQGGSTPQCQNFGPLTAPTFMFTELPGPAGTAGATLAPADGGAVIVGGSVPGPVNLLGFDGNTYNPTAFTLRTAEGFVYGIDQKLGVTSLTDPNGNTLSISPNGITSSTGASVPFTRDPSGRITHIADAKGNSATYTYDSNGDLVGSTDRQANTTAFFYGVDGKHNLQGIFTPDGNQALTNTYDATGRLTSTKDAFGASVGFTHDIANRKETVTDRLGNSTAYLYDSDGNVVQTTDALLGVTSATYDLAGNTLTSTNALGKTTTYTYDANDNRLTESDPLGHITTFTYTSLNKVLSVTDPNGHATTNTYDTNGNLKTTTDALGKTTTYSYAANGLLVSTKDALNHTTTFGYHSHGNLTSQTDAANTVTSYTYDTNGNRLTQSVTRTTPSGPQTLLTSFQYDAQNRLVKTVAPDGSNTQVVYNSLGQQSATIDALNRQTKLEYDSDGRLTKTTFPDNSTESSQYDNEGRRTLFTGREHVTLIYTYDKLGRLISTRNNQTSGTSSTTYDPAGQVLTSKDPRNNITTYAYDDAGRRTSITNALSQVTTFTYDNAGNQKTVLDANTHATTYDYDNANRLTKTTFHDGNFETTGYDDLGRVTSRTDANNKTTQYGYDALGRLTSVTDALGQLTSYGYDEVGNRIAQTDANLHATTYEFDNRGRRTKRTLPLGQLETYTYDVAGNLRTRTDFNGKTTTYIYDSVNRLLTKTPDPSLPAAARPVITFTYDPTTGKRLTMDDASGHTSYQYDIAARLQQVTKPAGLGQLGYDFDLANNLTALFGTGAGTVTYTYDALNRLKSVVEPNTGTSTYTYDAVGNLQSVTYPNGVVHAYAYDTRNRLTNLGVNKAATALASYAYTLDPAGHRTSVTELSGRTVNYAYDNLYRLTSETIAGASSQNGTISYTYDPVGNRRTIASTVPAIPAGTMFYDANDRFTGATADTYDNNGNTITSGGIANVYDFENHLIQKDGITMLYDGDGNRVSKTVAGVTTKYLVDDLNPTGYSQTIAEIPSNTTNTYFVWGLEQISRRQTLFTPSTHLEVRYFIHDGHGSVRQLTDTTAAVTDTYDYDAFGNLITHTGTTLNNYLFAGEQFDPDLNLYYNRARYLDVRAGRFWVEDYVEGDLFAPESLHKYVDVTNDPVNRVDRTGLQGDLGEVSAANSISEKLDAAAARASQTLGQKAKKILVCEVGKFVLEQGIQEGVYILLTDLGSGFILPYVGQTGELVERIATQLRDGKLFGRAFYFIEVAGGSEARRIAEQRVINALTGGGLRSGVRSLADAERIIANLRNEIRLDRFANICK